jgi:hypothetical protein
MIKIAMQPASAEPVYRSIWTGIRTSSSPEGYRDGVKATTAHVLVET